MINTIQSVLILILFVLVIFDIAITVIIGKMILKEAKNCIQTIEEIENRE